MQYCIQMVRGEVVPGTKQEGGKYGGVWKSQNKGDRTKSKRYAQGPSKAAVGAKTSGALEHQFEEVPAGCHERQEVGSTIQGALGNKRRTYRVPWEALVRRGTCRVPWEARGRKVRTGCPGRQQEEDVQGALGGTRSKRYIEGVWEARGQKGTYRAPWQAIQAMK
ncbi:hypothetical protein BGX38DRAFT_1145574 [Terfezia claveryi]|nr:hypothetical protein BGX38DRAFT_1145574 [Terfezia claveryi]